MKKENNMVRDNGCGLFDWIFDEEKEQILYLNSDNIQEKQQFIQNGEKYNYIILDDVLHLIWDLQGNPNVEEFLKDCKDCLNIEGKLIVNTSNRIGMQYLSGKANDYTNQYFDGIDSYTGEEHFYNYSQGELKKIFEKCGFEYSRWYYPYPNQNYTKEIFSEGSLEKYHYGRPYINLSKDRYHLFDETAFCETVVKEQIGEKMANAFLVILSCQEIDDKEAAEYIKLNWDRAVPFRIGTILRKNGTVEKYPLNETATKHIQKLDKIQKEQLGEGIEVLQGEYREGKMVYSLLKEKNLNDLILEAIEQGDKEKVIIRFKDFYDRLFGESTLTDQYHTEEFESVFGKSKGKRPYQCKAPMNIDLIADNIFLQNDQYVLIDCEWMFSFAIPVEFVIWRAINELYAKYEKLSRLISRNEFENIYGISEKDGKLFWEWSSYFAYEYVKSDGVQKEACEELPISLTDMRENLTEKSEAVFDVNDYVVNRCFACDRGEGFTDDSFLEADFCICEKGFEVKLTIPTGMNCRLLRWNPLKDTAYYFHMKKIVNAQIIGHNAYKVEKDVYSFVLGDSFFYFLPENKEETISILGEIRPLSVREQRGAFTELQDKLVLSVEEKEQLRHEIEMLKNENARIQQDLNSVLKSTIWRKTEPIRKWKDRKNNEVPSLTDVQGDEGQKDTVKTIEERIRYCIDSVTLENQMMCIDGWVLCEDNAIESATIVLEDIFGVQREYPFQPRGRRDVAIALNVKFDGDCGIHIAADYKSYCEQKVILRVRIEGRWYELPTNAVVPPTDNVDEGDFFFERYTENDAVLDYKAFKQQYVGDRDCCDVSDWKVDVIVPVYNGLKFLPGLFEGMEKTEVKYRLILVNDCSPDEAVLPYLKDYAEKHDNVKLLENTSNLGFVKSVNRALKITENHVALVNTDVELPTGWLERLMYPIFKDHTVASVTPFSNSATIFSFPDFAKDNKMFMGMDVETIDRVFATIKPVYEETPTGVGFCMGMNKHVIDEIGILDDETFEKGYGEENDWCQRAIKAGYKNVYAENLFVHHNHGGSFMSGTKQRLLQENGKRLQEKHPNYSGDVAFFCRKDPNKQFREYAKFELMLHSDVPCILAFDHELGGGASAYLVQNMKKQLAEDNMFAIVRYNMISNKYRMELYYGDYSAKVMFADRKELLNVIKQRYYEQIWINELATYVEIFDWLKDIVKIRKENAGALRLLLHDYFMICPSLNLMNAQGKYCKLPSEEMCMNCLKNSEFIYSSEYDTIGGWRNAWEQFMVECDEIIAFSKDTIDIIKRIYPDVANIQLIPHCVEALEKVERIKKSTDTYNVGVLGSISQQKGLHVVKRMLSYIEEKGMDMRIVILGESAEEIDSPAFAITGRYQREDIPKLTLENDIDVFLIPSVWPETFSYTTSEIMSMDMPIAVFNLGAPVERVKDYEKGLVLGEPDMDTEELVKALYQFAKKQVEETILEETTI